MTLLEEAIIYSKIMHQGKTRKINHSPYILHPLEVAQILSGMTDDMEIIAAGVLHDIVEDTDGTLKEIEKRFGKRVAMLVSEIVNGKEIYDGVKIYEGEWKDLAHHGQGTFYNAAGDVVYSGTFNDGYPGDEDKFMAGAKEVSYDALLSNPQHYMYDIIKVQGKIVYVWEDEDNYCEYLISTDESDEKTVYITYFRRSDDERHIQKGESLTHIQKGESLTVYGISEGLYTYETTEDTLATTPNMTMFFL